MKVRNVPTVAYFPLIGNGSFLKVHSNIGCVASDGWFHDLFFSTSLPLTPSAPEGKTIDAPDASTPSHAPLGFPERRVTNRGGQATATR